MLGNPNLLRLILFLVGIHSIMLGVAIFFFTTPFYQLFFSVDPDNVFFIKQAGIFLFLAGLFYLVPVWDLNRFKPIIYFVVISKIIAVLFLITHASLTPSPIMIYLAALGDGSMALIIMFFSWSSRRGSPPKT